MQSTIGAESQESLIKLKTSTNTEENEMDMLELGSAPAEEDCVSVTDKEDYMQAMREECRRYKALLESLFPVPDNVDACFAIKSYPHDFGTYMEVVVKFDNYDEKAIDFAFHVEENLPGKWIN
jgi:hypothetical protein